MIAAMLGEEEPIPIFVPVTSAVTATQGVTKKDGYADKKIIGYISAGSTSSITMKTDPLPTDAEIFFYSPSDYPREVELALTVNDGKEVKKGTFNGNDTARIISLGMQKKDDALSLKMTLKSTNLYVEKDANCFWYIDMAVFRDAMSRLQQNQLKINEFTEHSFEGTYTATRANEMILTTIAYDNGWEIWVNDERVETQKALGALVAFRIDGEAGQEYNIRMVYNPKTINIGLIVSIISICIFILLIVLERRFNLGCKVREDVNYNDGRGESDDDEQDNGAVIVAQEPDGWDKFAEASMKVLAKLKVIFIPQKREKYVHNHSKKKKKK